MISPFFILDCYIQIKEKEFDKDRLCYRYLNTGNYEIQAVVFSITDMRIKYYHQDYIEYNDKKIECTVVCFLDDSKFYCTLALLKFTINFIPEYIIKLNEGNDKFQS